MAEDQFIGREFEGFKITELLGKGGMGVVMKAEHADGRLSAVKLIRHSEAQDDQFIARFEREAAVLSALKHPNILQVYGQGKTPEGTYYILTEFVDGSSVGDVIKDYGRIPPATALSVILQTSKALKSAHLQNVIHRDIKPDNILLTKEGKVKLADFGLAKDTSDNQRLTITGQIMGTPAFMSPEQGQGEKLDHRTDIYSLGITLYYMLAGERPFSGSSPIEVVVKQIQEQAPPLSGKIPGLPEALYAMIDRMMVKNRDERFQDHQEVVDAITEIANEAGWDLGIGATAAAADAYDVTLDDVAGIAGMVREAQAAERTQATVPAEGQKMDTEDLVGDVQDSAVGQVIAGKYEIRSKLGEGGMGSVFLVRHKDLQQDYALKVLNPDIAGNEAFRERFLREAKAASAFTHKHAIQIRDFGQEGDSLYMTMDFSRGKTLKDVLAQEGSLSESRTARIGQQVLLALREAHSAGLIHRDLKPENIMIEKRGGQDFVRILDFGIAKMTGADEEVEAPTGPTLTRTGTVVGTIQYMSPEQASGDGDIDARSDLYSLSAILYECLTGKRHIEAKNMQQMMFRLATENPTPIFQHAKISKKIGNLVMKNLSRDRGKRSETAGDFLADLEATSAGLQSSVAVKRAGGTPWLIPAVAAGAVAAVVAVILLFVVGPFASSGGGSGGGSGGDGGDSGQTTKKDEEFDRRRDEAKAAIEAGELEKAKKALLAARAIKEDPEIDSLIRSVDYRIELAAYEQALAEKDYEQAMKHLAFGAKDNASTVEEKSRVAELESALQAVLDKARQLLEQAETLHAEKKYLAAMPLFGQYMAQYPKSSKIDAVRARYAELEDLTQNAPGLLVKSEPPGAEVMVDGRSRGQTPLMITDLAEGQHTVTLEREGFALVEREIEYTGERITLEETLSKEAFGALRIQASGSGFMIYLDSIRLGPAPQRVAKMRPGKHELRFVGPGDVAYEQAVEIEADRTHNLDIDFDALVAAETAAFQGLAKGTSPEETAKAYQAFVAKYPHGKFGAAARRIVAGLGELQTQYQTFRGMADPARRLALAEAYLKRWSGESAPLDWYVADVRAERDRILGELEQAAFDAIHKADDFTPRKVAAQEYLGTFSANPRARAVRALLADLEKEEGSWRAFLSAVGYSDRMRTGQAYLNQYEKGLKSATVKQEMDKLTGLENEAFSAFQSAASPKAMVEAGEAYLDRFPKGPRAEQVRNAVSQAQTEISDFGKTEQSAEACRIYLDTYPQGRFAEDVKQRLRSFGWKSGAYPFTGKLPRDVLRGDREGEYVNPWDDGAMVFIPAGFFPMGTRDFYAEDQDRPEVMVYLSGYFIDKYEVSNARYAKFLKWWKNAPDRDRFAHPDQPANHDVTPAFWNDRRYNQPDQPVVGVDWFSAWAYARWAGKTLPTEAQWEKAASARSTERVKTRFPWGEKDPTPSLCLYDGAADLPGPVNEKTQGASPYGALNMSGNVAEWCLDEYDETFLASLAEDQKKAGSRWSINPAFVGKPSNAHAVRGGHFQTDAEDLVVTRRSGAKGSDPKIGFRCARWHVE